MRETLLIELLTEELPPKSLAKLGMAFREQMQKSLADAEFIDRTNQGKWFATPRRLEGWRHVNVDCPCPSQGTNCPFLIDISLLVSSFNRHETQTWSMNSALLTMTFGVTLIEGSASTISLMSIWLDSCAIRKCAPVSCIRLVLRWR